MKNRGYYSKELTDFREISGAQSVEDFTFSTLVDSVLTKKLGMEKSIIVDFSPSFPVSLRPEYLYQTFVENYLDVFDKFKKDMGLEYLYYINVDFALNKKDSTKIVKRYKNTLVLSPFNFYKIIDSYKNNFINETRLLTLLHENGSYETKFITDYENLEYKDYYSPLTGDFFNGNLELPNDELCLFFKSFSLDIKGEIITKEFEHINSSDCINCNKCNKSCPVHIFPQFYYHYIEADFIEEAEGLLISKCTSCGICSFICPTHLPLTQSITKYLLEKEV